MILWRIDGIYSYEFRNTFNVSKINIYVLSVINKVEEEKNDKDN